MEKARTGSVMISSIRYALSEPIGMKSSSNDVNYSEKRIWFLHRHEGFDNAAGTRRIGCGKE